MVPLVLHVGLVATGSPRVLAARGTGGGSGSRPNGVLSSEPPLSSLLGPLNAIGVSLE